MRRRSLYWDNDYYLPSKPRDARGGIKARAKRGSFGSSWWARRWIEVLESFRIGARLQRGRAYARSGQALSIEIEKGIVRASVQGSRIRPYDVTIEIREIAAAQWKKVEKALAARPIYAAKLLAGEMPQDIEEAFRQAGVSLFPETSRDLKTECSCPDWSNPCKHIAAVYYLLGEEFDRDPFLIFKLRGRTREELVGDMRIPEAAGAADAEPCGDPLPEDPGAFWQGVPVRDDLFDEVRIPQIHASLVKRLGGFPFWRGGSDLVDALEGLYAKASDAGLEILLPAGDREEDA